MRMIKSLFAGMRSGSKNCKKEKEIVFCRADGQKAFFVCHLFCHFSRRLPVQFFAPALFYTEAYFLSLILGVLL